jgi:hypothetical protein
MRWAVVMLALVVLACGEEEEQTSFYDEAEAWALGTDECALVQFEPMTEGNNRGSWIFFVRSQDAQLTDITVDTWGLARSATEVEGLVEDWEQNTIRTVDEHGTWWVGQWSNRCDIYPPLQANGELCPCSQQLVEHLYD